jgi:hypothetical protein
VRASWEGGGRQTATPHVIGYTHAQETELDPMTEYKAVSESEKDKNLPGWIHREIRDHNRRYECDGHIFVDGRWGGLVCKKCGR